MFKKKKDEPKLPKKADKAIKLLEKLVEQLDFFYFGDRTKFRKHVLKDAIEIENILKDLAINKKETHRRIAKRYEISMEKKIKEHDDKLLDVNDTKLNERIKRQYDHDFKKP